MKIKINSIGFGDIKGIRTGENIVKVGLIIAVTGIVAVAIGTAMTKRTSWIAGVDENQIGTIQDIFKEFDSACKG